MTNKNPANYQVEDFVSDESFSNYCFNQDDKDKLYWQSWLTENPEKQDMAEAASDILRTLHIKLPEHEFEEELARLKDFINYYEYEKEYHVPVRKSRKWIAYLVPSVVLVLLIAYFLFPSLNNTGKFSEKVNKSHAPEIITLSDNTVITLAPGASLRYPEVFSHDLRSVELNGEAQFKVWPDAKRPFMVRSGEIVATVLGTVFNLKPSGDSIIQVELLEGKLKVESVDKEKRSMQSVILEPDQRVIYNSRTSKLSKESWQLKVEHVKFIKAGFEEIANEIKSVFGKTLLNYSNKQDWLFTGEFIDQSAEDIVENICLIKRLSYKIDGDTILILNAKLK